MSFLKRSLYFVSLFIFLISNATAATDEATRLRTEWAKAKFQTPRNKQIPVFEALIREGEKATAESPNNLELKLWYATILSTYASIKGGMGVLPHLKKARALLEEVIHKNGQLENGFAYGVLGTMYARVPGWPIAFGSKDKARSNLQMAIKLSPQGSDSNYYYGDFLVSIKDFPNARKHLEIAQKAPIRKGYEIQDKGRKNEIAASFAKMKGQ